ncbi:glycosyltransferase family 52 [Acinetobacter bereziniae]|uniref:glycosyltransferase family 52 n=2 Tax=Acinetobacter bereziniae TaxID=106648 RepID=UPI0034CE07E8|nr:glycosyltransferase family 52 [Acinetobacter bereziniae]
MGSLFICLTPLQTKICMRIIESKKIKKYCVVSFYLYENNKFDYYFNEIERKSENSLRFYPRKINNIINLFFDVYRFQSKVMSKFQNIFFDDIYLASLDNRYIQSIVSSLHYKNLYTFDDGLANINYFGSYYQVESLNFIKKKIWSFFGVKYFTEDVREFSKKHFSIYENKKNIINNVEYLSLFNENIESGVKEYEVFKVFLGTPLGELKGNFNYEMLNKLLIKLGINNYFPHPREKYLLSKSINILETDKIFEDYILDFYLMNNYKKIEIYSFCSTVILNLNFLDFINSIIIVKEGMFESDVVSLFDDFNVMKLNWNTVFDLI